MRLSPLAPLAGALLLFSSAPPAAATPQDAPLRGPRKEVPRWHALVHATVIPEPGVRLEDATIVLRNGVIESVEVGAAPPEGARVWDYTGLVVHAGFIEPHLEVEANDVDPDVAGRHWHTTMVVPERSALDGDGVSERDAERLRELGFTAALLVPDEGVLRGRAGVVALGDGGDESTAAATEVIAADVFDAMSFDRAGWGQEGALRYPTSEMGAIALARQAFLDADRRRQVLDAAARAPEGSEPPQPALALDALAGSERPLYFIARNELQVLRAARLAVEVGRPMVAAGTGTELRRLSAVADAGVPIVLPLAFPDAPDVSTIAEQEDLSLRELAGWEQAPTNPRRLVEAGVEIALTTANSDDFMANLRAAFEHGLGERDALAALTTTPARLLGVDGRLGRVAPGMLAHLVVREGEPFAEDGKVRDVWVGGQRHRINRPSLPSIAGTYEAPAGALGLGPDAPVSVVVEGRKKVTFRVGDAEVKAEKVKFGPRHAHFHMRGEALGAPGVLSASLLFEGESVHGSLMAPDGTSRFFSATLGEEEPVIDEADDGDDAASEEVDASEDEEIDVPEALPLPFGAFGGSGLPAQEDVFLHSATVWTAGPEGVIEDATIVVKDGVIRYVGPADGAPAPDDFARVIDASGLHVTPGLIDCHSHTGISGGVNEVGRRVTSEVRIADVIDPDDISFYHQLAGGLTAANQLHGSANAIGGQNSVVKLRWGAAHPDDLRLAGAKPGIKFALGENPKRVAAGSSSPDEYPQTRMGVEALIRDRLMAGRDYLAEHERYAKLGPWERKRTAPPRRDLELEAMAEIVAGERLIHCHSYRQDEILMLARIAQEFGFKIGTFQHVLEGYKVADAVRDSALGASTFSDWWAYKFEVVDAIPHNAALMTNVGANVSINSDSDEHARRLNTEAAKAMKYGGLEPHEALKLVTINPAIQLGVADRVGSIEPGKDADLAIWSGDPLSYRSRCLSTWIDGREVYSDARDRQLAEAAEAERQRIIQKLLAMDVKPPKPKADADADADEPESRRLARMRAEMEALWRSGNDPALSRPGVCGCFDVYFEQAAAAAEAK